MYPSLISLHMAAPNVQLRCGVATKEESAGAVSRHHPDPSLRLHLAAVGPLGHTREAQICPRARTCASMAGLARPESRTPGVFQGSSDPTYRWG